MRRCSAALFASTAALSRRMQTFGKPGTALGPNAAGDAVTRGGLFSRSLFVVRCNDAGLAGPYKLQRPLQASEHFTLPAPPRPAFIGLPPPSTQIGRASCRER